MFHPYQGQLLSVLSVSLCTILQRVNYIFLFTSRIICKFSWAGQNSGGDMASVNLCGGILDLLGPVLDII